MKSRSVDAADLRAIVERDLAHCSAELRQFFAEMRRRWTVQRVDAMPPASAEELAQFERTFHVCLPDAFAA